MSEPIFTLRTGFRYGTLQSGAKAVLAILSLVAFYALTAYAVAVWFS